MMTGFLFAFCTCVSLNFNSELFLVPYLYVCIVSLLIFAYFARSKTEAVSFYSFFVDDDDDSNSCVALHVRIANRLVTDSCCRGGIVNTRFGCSCERIVRPQSPNALWRFRASTSNNPSGRSRLHTYTHLRKIRHIHHTFAQQDIRVCGDDHFEPQKRQFFTI